MKNDKNFKIKLFLLWVFAFSVMIFIMSMSANAEEPYYPLHQNADNFLTSEQLEYFDSLFDSENNLIFGYLYSSNNGYNIMVFTYGNNSNNAMMYAELQNDPRYFNIYRDKGFTYHIEKSYEWNDGDFYNGSSWNINFNQFFSGIDATKGTFISNFDLYTNNDPETRELILNYSAIEPGPDGPIDFGVAIIPPTALVPEYLSGDTAPTNVPPSYIVNNYTWTTAPTFDGSSVINGIQSIKDTLDWLSANLHNEISNLVVNIKGLAEYIGKTIQYYGNMLVETINNGIQNFYDNMKALVEPIYTKLENFYNDFLEFADLFIHPFDEEEFQDQMESCELINQYNELMDNADDIRAIFNNAEERDYFVLYIDFENPFADSEHKIIHSEISFTWLKDYRSTYRPFLWLFTMIECFVGGMRLLGGIIGGKAK